MSTRNKTRARLGQAAHDREHRPRRADQANRRGSRPRQEQPALRTGARVRVLREMTHAANRRRVRDADGFFRYVADPQVDELVGRATVVTTRYEREQRITYVLVEPGGRWYDQATGREEGTLATRVEVL